MILSDSNVVSNLAVKFTQNICIVDKPESRLLRNESQFEARAVIDVKGFMDWRTTAETIKTEPHFKKPRPMPNTVLVRSPIMVIEGTTTYLIIWKYKPAIGSRCY